VHRINILKLWKTRFSRTQIGAGGNSAKLSEADVLKIFKLYSDGMYGTKIAKMFGVNYSAIYKILRGERWKYLISQGRATRHRRRDPKIELITDPQSDQVFPLVP